MFRPRDQDEGRLSVDRAAMCSAEEAYGRRQRATQPHKPPIGVLSLGPADLADESLEAWEDPIPHPGKELAADTEANPAHALIDLAERAGDRQLRERLLKRALGRGWEHGPFGLPEGQA